MDGLEKRSCRDGGVEDECCDDLCVWSGRSDSYCPGRVAMAGKGSGGEGGRSKKTPSGGEEEGVKGRGFEGHSLKRCAAEDRALPAGMIFDSVGSTRNTWYSGHRSASTDGQFERSDPLDPRADPIPRDQGTNACRCTGEDQVAGLEFDRARYMADHIRH